MSQLHYQARLTGNWWQHHPVLVQLLGISPLLAVGHDLAATLLLGAATLLLLLSSAVIVSALRHKIPPAWCVPCYIAISTTLTMIISEVLQLFWPELVQTLGIYLPLMACNYLVVMELHRGAGRQVPLLALRSALVCGLSFATMLLAFALFRSGLAGAGNWLYALMDSASLLEISNLAFAPGVGFILLGLAIAASRLLTPGFLAATERTAIPARRARATGRIR